MITKLEDVSIEFLNLKTEIRLSNYASNIDTINNIVTIVSRPIENLVPIYRIKDITLKQNKQIAQTIRQEQ